MEDLKQYRVNFRVTYHCIGRKGFFRKKEYTFDFIVESDQIEHTQYYINSKKVSRAIKRTRMITEKYVSRKVEQVKKFSGSKKEFLILGGNDSKGEFRLSPKVYDITGADIELVKITQLKVWKEEKVSEAMKGLSIEEFKSVFGETIPQQEETK